MHEVQLPESYMTFDGHSSHSSQGLESKWEVIYDFFCF